MSSLLAPAPVPTEKPYLGKTIAPDGTPRYSSVSQLTLAGGCQAQWWWKYMQGKREERKKSQIIGDAVHLEMHNFFVHGADLGPITIPGKIFMPQPLDEVVSEAPLATLAADGTITSTVYADGVPLIGYVDALLPGRVIDIKSKSKRSAEKFSLTASELAAELQMVGYAKHEGAFYGNTGPVTLRHWYFLSEPKYRSWVLDVTVPRDRIEEHWQPAHAHMKKIRTLATIPLDQVKHVPTNTAYCQKYGGCPHLAYCEPGNAAMMQNLFANTDAAEPIELPEPEEKEPMSLLPQTSPDVLAELAKLKNNEVAANQDAARASHLLHEIQKAGWGSPPLVSEAAALICRAHNLPIQEFAGTDKLADIRALKSMAELEAIAVELQQQDGVAPFAPFVPTAVAAPALTPVAPAPQPAPTMAPPPAAPPVSVPQRDPVVEAHAIATTQLPGVAYVPPGVLPPDAPSPSQTEDIRKGVGRPKKVKATPPPQGNVIQAPIAFEPPPPAATPAPTPAPVAQPTGNYAAQAEFAARNPAPPPVAAPTTPAGLELYIDCLPTHVVPVSLYGYVADVIKALNATFGVVDIRMADKNSPLAYCGWRGALEAAVKNTPPPPGAYCIDTRGNEINETIAIALIPVASLAVRGMR